MLDLLVLLGMVDPVCILLGARHCSFVHVLAHSASRFSPALLRGWRTSQGR
jgi:hypothetical protein